MTDTANVGQQVGPNGPEWMVVIRVYGSILYTTKKWGDKESEEPIPLEPHHIESWMEDCASHGVTTVLWRANVAGALTYPSRFTALAGEVPLPDPNQGMGIQVDKQGWSLEDWEYLGMQCRSFNTLEVAVDAAHRHNLSIYLDFHTFDMVGSWCTLPEWPGGGERAWNPDWWLWSKDHSQRLAGIPCYADENVREKRLLELSEALDYGIDGVVLGFFSHVDGAAGDRPHWFGYNEVVAREYEKRYGSDPSAGDVDPHLLCSLNGEYFTEFVRGASELTHKRNKKLICTTRPDGVHGWGGKAAASAQMGTGSTADLRDGSSDLPLAAGFYLEWEKWARDGLADGLLFWAPFEGGLETVRKLKSKVDVPVYIWRKYGAWRGNFSPPQSLERYVSEIGAVRRGALDGYCLHLLFLSRHGFIDPDWRGLLSDSGQE